MFHHHSSTPSASPASLHTDAFRLLVESVNDAALFLLDSAGRIVSWNIGAERLLGFVADECVGQSLALLYTPADVAAGKPARALRSALESTRFEEAGTRAGKDGSPFLATCVLTALREHGRSVGFAVALRHIPDREHESNRVRRAESESRRAGELLRAVADGTTDAVFVKDRDGKYLLFNEAAARFVGKPVAEVLGKDDTALFEADSARWVMERDRRVMDAGVVETEEEVLEAAGITRTYQATKAPYRDATGNAIGLVGISRDITERKRAEEKLLLFRTLIDQTTDGIEVIDPETGHFLDVNEKTCLAHGYTREEYLTLSVADIDPVVATRPWLTVMEERRGTGFQTFESQHRRKDGSIFPVEVNMNYIRLDRGYVVAVVRDITERKRAEAALRREREFVWLVLDTDPNLIFVKDAAGRFVLVNKAMANLYGTTPQALVGKQPEDFKATPSEFAEYRRVEEEVLRTNRPVVIDETNTRADGRVFWFHTIKVPLVLPDGTTHVLGIAADITERKEAEQALRESEARTHAVIQTALDCIVVIDHRGCILEFNRAAEQTFGYRRDEILGRELTRTIIPAEYREPHRAGLAHYLLTGEGPVLDRRLELPAVRKNGERFLAEVSIGRNPGEPPTFTGFLRDITDRKRAEEALRQVQQRLQYVLSSSPTVLFTLAIEENRIRGMAWISENMREMLGYDPEEAAGSTWWRENVHPDDREQVLANIGQELFATGRVANEYRFLHRNGQYRWLRSEVRLLRDARGTTVEAIGSWSDVTERKLIEEKFRQSQKMEAVGRLAGGVAHDFNNLLTVINGYAGLLAESIPASNPNHAAAVEIGLAGVRAAELTAQLLAFSRKAIIEPKILDLNDIVSQSAKLLCRLIGEDITLVTVLAPRLARVKVDPSQIEQAIMNLAVNARDAMPTGGRLTIETRLVKVGDDNAIIYPDLETGRYVELVMTDTGHGMPEDVMAQIFEPFFTTKEVGKGTGLGLATVYGIVKTYGGHIGVESGLGAGTTFKILLPTVVEKTPVPVPAEKQAAPMGSETVLLVEDEPAVRGVAKLALRRQGYTVLEAGGGTEAIRVAANHTGPIHMLVTDVVMPGMSGREVAETLRASHPGLKILYVSGYTDDAIVRHGIFEATDAFLQKPFTPLSLSRKVRVVLDGNSQ